METFKHPACTIGWVAQLSQLAFLGESNLNFPREKFHCDNAVVKKKKYRFAVAAADMYFASVTEILKLQHRQHETLLSREGSTKSEAVNNQVLCR